MRAINRAPSGTTPPMTTKKPEKIAGRAISGVGVNVGVGDGVGEGVAVGVGDGVGVAVAASMGTRANVRDNPPVMSAG